MESSEFLQRGMATASESAKYVKDKARLHNFSSYQLLYLH